MRRCALGAASMLVVSSALLLSFSPASGASGFHCPGTPGSANHSFAYMRGVTGQPSPSQALTHFLRTGSDGLHLPLRHLDPSLEESLRLFGCAGEHPGHDLSTSDGVLCHRPGEPDLFDVLGPEARGADVADDHVVGIIPPARPAFGTRIHQRTHRPRRWRS